MKRKHFIFALVAMLLSFSVTTSAEELLVNCDYNSSTEGYGVSKFSNYAGAYAYAKANDKTSATIVIEKTNTLSGNTFDNNHTNYSSLAVVIKDGATMGNAASKWDMTYPVTVEPGGTLTCARPASASVSYIHIKNKLIVGAKGSTKKAVVDFLSDTYQDCDISIRYNGSIEVYNADFKVQDLDAQGNLTIEDSKVEVDGAFASATYFFTTTLTNTEMVVNGNQISGGLSDFAGGTSNQLGNVKLNNSTLTIKEGDTKVAATVTATNSTIAVNNLTVNSGKTLNLNEGSTLEAENITTAGTGSVKIDGVQAPIVDGAIVVPVADFAALKAAVEAGKNVQLTADITTSAAITTSGVTSVIDLNGKTLTIGAGDNKFNDESNITIKNGTVSITGVTVGGNAIFCLDEYEKALVTTVTLDNVNLVGEGYSSAYGIFYIGESSVLNVKGGEWNLKNDTHTSGGVFKADGSGAKLNIDGLNLTAHNVRRVVTYAATTIENSTMAISGDADGVDAQMEHGFNRSPLAITNSTITMKDMVGRGITAQNGAVTISENSKVEMTNCQEATIDVRGNQTVTIDNTSTVSVDKKPTVASGSAINGTVQLPPMGNDFTGYTRGDAIWGEVWGNAKESFVIKVLDANGNVMGTTSLNNIDGIIDGDVNVTWSLKLDAASNTDEYWTMAWTTAPTIDNMPAKVELWVDGVKVSGGNVVLNGPDEIAKIYAAVTDASGKILGYHTDIQEAIKAAAAVTSVAKTATAGTVEVLSDVTVDKWVMFAEKMTISDGSLITLNINGVTIDGNGKTLTIKSIESAGNGGYLFYDAQNLTVKDLTINIADGLVGGIGLQSGTISNVTFNGGQYAVLPGKDGVTIDGCTFNDTKGYAIYYEDARPGIVVDGNTFNTAEGKYAITMRSNEQFTNNTINTGRVNLANSAASTVSGNDFGEERFKVYNGATATISDNEINNLVFNETTSPAASTFANNTLSAEAQAAIEALPVMAGDGTEANPYTIGNLTQLKAFRDDVNAGNNYQGKFVKLTADIDLNNEEWTPIGNVTYDSNYKPTDASKVFSGVFNGNGKVISNLKVASTVGGVDTQANVGLFGITGEGAVIKDLTLTNVNIETDGRNVGALAGFAYKATLSNITVNGNIQIKGGNNVAGVAGMTRYYDMSATNMSVSGANGSAIVGNNIVGGIFAEIAPNGSEQTFKGLNVENVAITGAGGVGGIVGLLTTGTVENVSVKNVALTGRTDYQGNAMGRIRLGSVAGLMGSKYATIANETVENVTAKNLDGNAVELPVIGANYDAASNATEAKIGNTYYATLAGAFTAVGDGAGKTVELIADVDLADAEWTPVTFNGVFDGQNHTISNLVVNGAGKSNQGFFAQTQNGEIKNVTFKNAKVTGRLNVGVVAGTPYTSKYTNVKVTGHVEVNGMAYVGGVGGKNAYANWTDITVDVDDASYVKATSTENGTAYRTYVGGVIGFNGEGGHTFKNISSNIKVIGDVCDIGGIFGILHYGNKVETVTFAGQVEAPAGAKEVGAIAGVWHNQVGQSVTINNATIADGSTVKVGDVTTTGSIVGGAYNAENQSPETSGSLKVDGKEVWVGLAKVGEVPYETLAAAVAAAQPGETVTLLADLTMSEIFVLDKAITLDGNGKTLTSTAGRAINVSGANGVTIKNLTINASGERAINVIQNATNVTIEKVTATAANYTVNVAASAPNAVVAIKNSTLNGLCTVNVAAAGAAVTVDNSTVNCNDNNTTAGESYAALCLNKEAVGGSIVATNSTINVTDGSDSEKGRNGAENGTVTINGSTDGVAVTVAAITYEGSTNYYGFATLEDAIEFAKAGDVITLIRDVTVAEKITIAKAITLDGNGKTLTYTGNGASARAIDVPAADGVKLEVTIKNLTVDCTSSYCQRGINYNEDGKLTLEGVTVKGMNVTYALNLPGSSDNCEVTITDSDLSGNIALNVWGENSVITANNSEFVSVDNSTAEGYVAISLNNDGAGNAATGSVVTINGGKIIAKDDKGEPSTAVRTETAATVNVSEETEVVGSIKRDVAIVTYEGSSDFYSFDNLQSAIDKAIASNGNKVVLLDNITIDKKITISASVAIDGNGKTITYTGADRAIDVPANAEAKVDVTIENLTVDCNASYCQRGINYNEDGKLTLNKVTVKGTSVTYALNLPGSSDNCEVTITDSKLTGNIALNVWGANSKVTATNSEFVSVDNSTAEGYVAISLNNDGAGNAATGSVVTINGGKIIAKDENGNASTAVRTETAATVHVSDETEVVGSIKRDVAIVTYEGSTDFYSFETVQSAIDKAIASNGNKVVLLDSITIDKKITISASVAIDGNGKTITYTGTDRAIDVPANAEAKVDVTIENLTVVATTANRGLNYNENGKFNVEGVTVTIGENVDGYAINFPSMADSAQVTIKDSKLTSRNPLNIWGENMVINVYDSEIISVENSSTYDYAAIQLNNDNYGNVANGTTVNVYGGKITALNDEGEPSNVVANATETGVVNISDETVVTGKVLNYVANIGGVYFGSLQAAVNAIEKYGYNSPIVIMKSFATSETATVKNGLNVTIDLNGKTITGTDNTSKNFEAIKNQGTLTIKDSSADKTGKITVTATTNSGWNRYSAVIANTVGGKLTVEGGTLEHLGGTDMAYGIDNLTNGKGTYAETVINGGTIKSTYRGIRQFLNGTEAQNILTINGGTVEGANKSVWMQDPNTGANTGTLTITENAKLVGDVYLFVTAGSTEWPVEVSIAAAALQGESKVMTGNVPAQYAVSNVNGVWGVTTAIVAIDGKGYASLAAAITAAQANDVITFLQDINENVTVNKNVTIDGAGKKYTGTMTGNAGLNVTVQNVNFVNGGFDKSTKSTTGTYTIKDCTFDGAVSYTYAFRFKGANKVVVENCTVKDYLYSFLYVTSSTTSVSVKDVTVDNCPSYAVYFASGVNNAMFENLTVKNSNNGFVINNTANRAFTMKNCKMENVTTAINHSKGTNTITCTALGVNDLGTAALSEYAVIKGATIEGSTLYGSVQGMVEKAENGQTVKLLSDITMETSDELASCDGYPSFVHLEGKAVTVDLNGKAITVNASAEELAGKMLVGVFSTDNSGELTLVDSSAEGTGSVTLTANDAKVYSLLCNYEDGCKMTINGGTYTADKVHDCLVYSGGKTDAIVTVNGGNFTLGNVGAGENGKPWIFNVLGAGDHHVLVNGGTFNADINRQHWSNEVYVAKECYTVANTNDTYTVKEGAVAYVNMGMLTGPYFVRKNVGYATLGEAFAAADDDETITMLKDVTLDETLVVTADKDSITLDLAGKTINAGWDDETAQKHIYAIDNKGNLVIKGNGTINARGIYNYGELTLNGATINAIDANGGYAVQSKNGAKFTMEAGTIATTNEDGDAPGSGYDATTVRVDEGAEFIMNGGEIKNISNYTFAIENYGTTTVKNGKVSSVHSTLANHGTMTIYGGEFTCNGLDGITAQVIWATDGSTTTINGGTFDGKDNYNGFNVNASAGAEVIITGGNFLKSHSGSLYGDGNIEVSGGFFYEAVLDKYCAADYRSVEVGDGRYTVERYVFEIVDGEVTEFSNDKDIENVTITYKRTFRNTGAWQTLYVPFEIPVHELIDNGYSVAYVNDVQALDRDEDGDVEPTEMTVEYVYLKNGILKANHPYVIKPNNDAAKTMELVLNDAKLYGTSAEIQTAIDISTAYVKFDFKGTLSKTPADELGANVFSLNNSGIWQKLGSTVNLGAFRVYFTMENKNGSPIIIPEGAEIRSRVVGEKDEATGIITPIVEGDVRVNDGTIFDLMGRPVRTPEKGKIYIMNGKKVLF